jgi:hypothetical protein
MNEPPLTKFQFVTVPGSGAFELMRCNSSNVGESTCKLLSPIFGSCKPRQSIAVVPGMLLVDTASVPVLPPEELVFEPVEFVLEPPPPPPDPPRYLCWLN